MTTHWLRLTLENLRVMLSKLPAVQSFLGAADDTEALTRLHRYEVQDDGSQTMPRATLWMGGGRVRHRRGGTHWNTSGGTVAVMFEEETPSGYLSDKEAAADAFLTKLESIINEIEADQTMDISEIHELVPAEEGEKEENRGKPFFWAVFGFVMR